MAIPEFILRKLFVRESLRLDGGDLLFVLRNTFAPGTITGLSLEVDGKPLPQERILVQAGEAAPREAAVITPAEPLAFAVGVDFTVRARGLAALPGRLGIRAETREAGPIAFAIRLGEKTASRRKARAPTRRRFFSPPWRAEVVVDAGEVVGEINPFIYGHFIEHLERCVYGGVWSDDGSHVRSDTLALIRDLRPPLIRYPGGNFASGYHWEDGIGPVSGRPERVDRAWNAAEPNRVGTDEFLAFCREAGAEPFLVVNDGSGSPEEAARWVGYCNQPANRSLGARRAANGHPDPYRVRIWGVGNEVWGRWQIGTTDAEGYSARLLGFAKAMRETDPAIQIVAVGDGLRSARPDEPSRRWNETVLARAGDAIDYLSFHIYQPGEEGWREAYDPEALHHTVCAAPLDIEAMIHRLAEEIHRARPGRRIGVALDEWNLWLAPPEGAATMHRVVYTLRDALYAAGVLNAFHRCAGEIAIANLAQLVNVLPAIVTEDRAAYPTPIYFPFLLYREMESIALRPKVDGPTFNSLGLGERSDALEGQNINSHAAVPYLDVTATCDPERRRVVIGLVNRHPFRPAQVRLSTRGLEGLRPSSARALTGPGPLAANDLGRPSRVHVGEAELPRARGGRLAARLPASSVTVWVLE